MVQMFMGAKTFNGAVDRWNVGQVTDMRTFKPAAGAGGCLTGALHATDVCEL